MSVSWAEGILICVWGSFGGALRTASFGGRRLAERVEPPPHLRDSGLEVGIGVFPGFDKPLVGSSCFFGLAHLLVELTEPFVGDRVPPSGQIPAFGFLQFPELAVEIPTPERGPLV